MGQPGDPPVIVHLIIWQHDKNSNIEKTVSSTNHTSHEMWAGLCPLLTIVFKIYELWSRLPPRHSSKTRKVFLCVYLSSMVKSWWVFVIYFREILQKSCTASIKQRIQSRLTPGEFGILKARRSEIIDDDSCFNAKEQLLPSALHVQSS